MKPYLIKGGKFSDQRGAITFVNDFDMSPIKRFYLISPENTSIVRAWQGHQHESKWFHVVSGKFLIRLIQIDNWDQPSTSLLVSDFVLSADDHSVLHIPGGYVNGFQMLENNSSLMIYSDADLEASKLDDYRFDQNYWFNWK